jgi:hypothetical protein
MSRRALSEKKHNTFFFAAFLAVMQEMQCWFGRKLSGAAGTVSA